MERLQFNYFVLQSAIGRRDNGRGYAFVLEDLLDGRAPVTNKMVELLILEGQDHILADMICIPIGSKACRPEFILEAKQEYSNKIKQIFGTGNTKVQFKDT